VGAPNKDMEGPRLLAIFDGTERSISELDTDRHSPLLGGPTMRPSFQHSAAPSATFCVFEVTP